MRTLKKSIAVLLAVLMVAFSVPFSALAAYDDYEPDVQLVFNPFYETRSGVHGGWESGDGEMYMNASLFDQAVVTGAGSGYTGETGESKNIKYTDSGFGQYGIPLTYDYTYDTTTGAVSGNLAWNASMLKDYVENEYEETLEDYGFDANYSQALANGDMFTVTVVMKNVSTAYGGNVQVKYSDNIEPAGVYRWSQTSGKGKNRVVTEYTRAMTLTEAAAAQSTADDGTFTTLVGGTTPVQTWSANAFYSDINDPNELGDASSVIASSRVLDCNNSFYGDPSTETIALDGISRDMVNPETGEYYYNYDNTFIYATFVFKMKDATAPVTFEINDPTNTATDFTNGVFMAIKSESQTNEFWTTYSPASSNADTAAAAANGGALACGKMTFFGGNINTGVYDPTHAGGGEDPGECTHAHLTAHPAVAATCVAAGNSAYWTCDDCNKMFSDANATTEISAIPTIPATGNHNYTETSRTDATCITAGVINYECSVCHDTKTEPIPATGVHTYGDTWTDSQDGLTHYKECNADVNCHERTTENHTTATREENRVEPQIGVPGSYDLVTYCTVCGAVISTEPQVIPAETDTFAFDHYVIDKTTNKAQVIYKGQTTGETKVQATVDVDYNEVPATCTAAGSKTWTVQAYDGNAGTATNGGIETEAINATGHNMTKVEASAPTCQATGNNEYYVCGNCQGVFKDANGTEATTVEAETLATVGHNMVLKTAEVPATCTEPGTTAVYECSFNCGTTTGGDVIPAPGHSWGNWTVTKEATKSTAGEETRECANCDATETQPIATLPITVTVKGDAVVDGNFTATADGYEAQLSFGDEYTVQAAEGKTFEGWKIGGKVVSTDEEYTNVAFADVVIEPVYAEEAVDTYTVTYYDLYSNIVAKVEVAKGETVTEPAGPARPGYTFKGWDKSPDEITGTCDVYGKYEKDAAQTYAVNVVANADVTINGEATSSKDGFLFNEQVTVVADGAKAWYIGGKLVATGDTYTFFIGSDVTVTPEFTEAAEGAVVAITSVSLVAGTGYKYQFLASKSNIPAGYSVVELGFVYGKNREDADLDLDKVDGTQATLKACHNKITGANEWALTFGLKNKDGNAKVRAFITIKNNAGDTKVVYSDIETINY